MADRKRPLKKKATKKVKKSAKPDEKQKKTKTLGSCQEIVISEQDLSPHKSIEIKRSSSTSDIISYKKKSIQDCEAYKLSHAESSGKNKKVLSVDDLGKRRSPKRKISSEDIILKRKTSLRKPVISDENLTRKLSMGQHQEYIERQISSKVKLKNSKSILKQYDSDGISHYRYRSKSHDSYKKIPTKRSSRVSLSSLYINPEERVKGGAQNTKSKETFSPVNKYDYIGPPDHGRTNLKIAIACLEICGVSFLTLSFAHGLSETTDAAYYTGTKGAENGKCFHILYASFWIFLAGNAMILYRLFNQSKVACIKLFHLTFHSVGFFFLCLSLDAYNIWWENKKFFANDEHYFSVHSKIGMLTVFIYIIQVSMSLVVYLLCNQRRRANSYHYHSFLGLFIFFMGVTAVCTGIIMEEKYSKMGLSTNPYSTKWIPKVGGMSCVLFSGCVLFIVIYPYFDFEKDNELL